VLFKIIEPFACRQVIIIIVVLQIEAFLANAFCSQFRNMPFPSIRQKSANGYPSWQTATHSKTTLHASIVA
jgi:hypothetical protein